VWDAWLECYTAGRLVARSDGEFIWYQIDTKTGETIVHNGRDKEGNQVKHPADNVGGYDYQNKPCFFKQTGRLKVIVPELQRLAYLTFLTSSKLDIINISSQLNGIEYMTGGNLAGVPLILSRRKKMVSCPKDNKGGPERVRREKWMVSIEADPKWVKQELKQLSAAAYPQLAAGEVIESEYTEEESDPEEDYREEDVELEKRNSPSPAAHVENNPVDVHPIPEPEPEEIPEPEYIDAVEAAVVQPGNVQPPLADEGPARKPLMPSVLKQYLASKAAKIAVGYEASTKQRWLAGEIMVSSMKAVGCIGMLSNGPSRDVDAVRRLNFQMLLGGVTAGHGEMAVQAVNVPVSVGGMDVAPGELIHMDENGAVKFPADRAAQVLENAQKMLEGEAEHLARLRAATNAAEVRAAGGAYAAKRAK
jgi:hypothetical protein